MGEVRNVYKIFDGKLEGKRSLGRSRRRWGREIRWDVVDCFHLAQDRVHWRTVVNTVMNIRVP
jgi:hypothetical protein